MTNEIQRSAGGAVASPYAEAVEVVSMWITSFESEATRRSYESALFQYAKFALGAEGEREMTAEAYSRRLEVDIAAANKLLSMDSPTANKEITRFRTHMKRVQGASDNTIKHRIGALSSLCEFARSHGVPAPQITRRRSKITLRRDVSGLTIDEMKAVLKAAEEQEDELMRLRDVAIVRLLFGGGMRRSALASLRVKDLSYESGKMFPIDKGTGGERVKRPLPEGAGEAISAWLKASGRINFPEIPVFCSLSRNGQGAGKFTGMSVYRIWRRLADSVGVTKSPHSIRHLATNIADASNTPIGEIMDAMGWSDPRMYGTYRDRIAADQSKFSSTLEEALKKEKGGN